ncbi:MAG: hypothetical protein KJ072_25955 [Verrucomicrobia bacterium]|nr:hypothetical protein [Verrucomicrobiota bacterium]
MTKRLSLSAPRAPSSPKTLTYGSGGGGGASGGDATRNGANAGFGAGGGGGGTWVGGVGGITGGGNGGWGSATSASGGGGGGSGVGAGVFVRGGAVSLVNCTITGNECRFGDGGLGMGTTGGSVDGIRGRGLAGGVFNHQGSINLVNSIVAGNTVTDESPDPSGVFVSNGFNLVGSNAGASGLSVLDYQNEAPGLDTLQDNGGWTLTHALTNGSLCIGAASSAAAPALDQRGKPRPVGQRDIGAFQTGPTPPAPTLSISPIEGAARITVGSTNGAAVRIEGSTNLSPDSWTTLTNVTLTSDSLVFTNNLAPSVDERFWRAIAW